MSIRLFRTDPARPFQLVKFVSWSFFLVILGCSILMILVIGNYAKRTILQKNREYAHLLAENLNHQIYRRFTLPTVLGYGQVQLKQKQQYERLDRVIRATIHGFRVLDVRVLDLEGKVAYAMYKDEFDEDGMVGRGFQKAKEGEPFYQIIRKKGSMWSFLDLNLPDRSHILHTSFPLRAEQSLSPQKKGPIIGILQFSQDITKDHETIFYFQILVAVIIISSSLLLFFILYMIIRRADRTIAERIREKERLEHKLHQNEKLASMGRMVASISHEIRNPLGIIQSSAEMLVKRSRKGDSAESRLAGAVYEESQRLSRTVQDFLDYARPKEPTLHDVDLSAIVEQCLASLDTEIKRKQTAIQLQIPEKIPLQGDKDLLYLALYNLIINALQAMESPGEIRFTWLEKENQLEIRDSGPGFRPDLVDKFTEPFFTTKEKGTGLGLAIVKNILDSHGAKL
ncbi:MAG: two-component sensor histidine kinase, partial [Desulfohalobiaceae bacterium]|nr:two-component sensor histidine kinase [Desulfohalobiaceae bacterium]